MLLNTTLKLLPRGTTHVYKWQHHRPALPAPFQPCTLTFE